MLTGKRIKMRVLRFVGRLQQTFRQNTWFILGIFIMNYFTMAWSLINADKIEVMVGYGFTFPGPSVCRHFCSCCGVLCCGAG